MSPSPIIFNRYKQMSKQPSWDDIPSLNLSLDTSSSEKTRDSRKVARIATQDVMKMITDEVKVIYVQVVTKKGLLKKKGILQDISQNGLCFIMPTHEIVKGEPVRIGLMLGKRPFQTAAIVRWATNDQVGVEYRKPKPEDVTFLADLYSAQMLNRI